MAWCSCTPRPWCTLISKPPMVSRHILSHAIHAKLSPAHPTLLTVPAAHTEISGQHSMRKHDWRINRYAFGACFCTDGFSLCQALPHLLASQREGPSLTAGRDHSPAVAVHDAIRLCFQTPRVPATSPVQAASSCLLGAAEQGISGSSSCASSPGAVHVRQVCQLKLVFML